METLRDTDFELVADESVEDSSAPISTPQEKEFVIVETAVASERRPPPTRHAPAIPNVARAQRLGSQVSAELSPRIVTQNPIFGRSLVSSPKARGRKLPTARAPTFSISFELMGTHVTSAQSNKLVQLQHEPGGNTTVVIDAKCGSPTNVSLRFIHNKKWVHNFDGSARLTRGPLLDLETLPNRSYLESVRQDFDQAGQAISLHPRAATERRPTILAGFNGNYVEGHVETYQHHGRAARANRMPGMMYGARKIVPASRPTLPRVCPAPSVRMASRFCGVSGQHAAQRFPSIKISGSPKAISSEAVSFRVKVPRVPKSRRLVAMTKYSKSQHCWDCLLAAVRDGDRVRLNVAMDLVFSVQANANFWEPLQLAIRNSSVDMVQALAEHRIDVNVFGPHRVTPLYEAIKVAAAHPSDDSMRVVEILLDAGADPNLRSMFPTHQKTCLHLAAESGLLLLVEWLLEAGASVGAVEKHGLAAMHVAKTSDIVTALWKAGANVDDIDSGQITPLVAAVRRNNLTVVQTLLSLGARHSETPDTSNALEAAAETGHSQMCKLLVQHGATSRRAVGLAVLGAHVQTAKLLLSLGTQANKYQLLQRAAWKDDVEMVEMLLAEGAPTNDPDVSEPAHNQTLPRVSYSPLHAAVRNRNRGIVCKLLAHGADPNAVCRGWGCWSANWTPSSTPLQLACSHPKDDVIVQMLEFAGAQQDAENVM